MYGRIDLYAVISITENRIKRSGFTLREFDESSRFNIECDVGTCTGAAGAGVGTPKKLVIQHDMGRNWSVFFTTYVERLINNVGYATKVGLTDNSWMIEILAGDKETKCVSERSTAYSFAAARIE
jgi:hypothetical protein